MKAFNAFLSLLLLLPLSACSGPEEKKKPAPKTIVRPKKTVTLASVKLGLKSPKGSDRLSAMDDFEKLTKPEQELLIPDLWEVLQGKGLVGNKDKKPIVSQGRINPLGVLGVDDDGPRSRGKAALELGVTADLRSYPVLMEALKDENFQLREWVGMGLVILHRRHPFVKRKLIAELASSPSYVRKEILEILSEMTFEEDIEAVYQKALGDPSVDVRVCALQLLAEKSSDDGVELYIKSFLGPDRFLQLSSAKELAGLGDYVNKDVKDRILKVLITGLTTPHSFRPISAAKGLSILGDARALPALCKTLETRDKVTRRWAYESLSKLLLDKNCPLKAAEIDRLIGQLSHKRKDIRINAATLLGGAKVEEAKAGLTLMADNDKDKKARAAAKRALAEFAAPSK